MDPVPWTPNYIMRLTEVRVEAGCSRVASSLVGGKFRQREDVGGGAIGSGGYSGVARLHPDPNEAPRTEKRLPLGELLTKAGDGDFLRSVAEAVLVTNEMLEQKIATLEDGRALWAAGGLGDEAGAVPCPPADTKAWPVWPAPGASIAALSPVIGQQPAPASPSAGRE
jgi:hypothetical protein